MGENFIIRNNDKLKNLDELSNITSVGGLIQIGGNNNLTDLGGLSNISFVGEALIINYNDALTNLNGLSNVTSVGDYLIINSNGALTNLDGLSNITTVGGYLSIENNDALTNLDGLFNITTVGGNLRIINNSALSNCCGIQNLLFTPGVISGSININNNPSECSSESEILSSNCGLRMSVVTNPPCIDASNGSLQINLTAYDTIPFFYNWTRQVDGVMGSGVSAEDFFSIDDLEAGTYNITITNPRPDTVIKENIVLTQVSGSFFEIIEITTTNSSNGTNNGSIHITISGDTAPYHLEWSGESSGSQLGSNDPSFTVPFLVQGEYNITVFDDIGNEQSIAVSLLDEIVPAFPCESPLDIVILNDVSGSVDATEYDESKQFFVDFLSEANIGFGIDESRAAIIEWSSGFSQQLIIPMTGDSIILKTYVHAARAFSGGTSPHEAMTFGEQYLDSIARPDVEGVLILSTDGSGGQISPSLVALADQFKAAGYHIITIAFDGAYSSTYTRELLRQVASIDQLAPGAPAYSLLDKDLAHNIVNLYLCPIDPGSSATAYFNRDGALDILDISPIGNCPFPDGVEVTFTVEALRELSLPAGTPISFYHNNPTSFGANYILTWLIPCATPVGTKETFTVTLPVTTASNIYAVLNDDHSQSPPISLPVTAIEELAYSNNIDNRSICTDDIATIQAFKYTTTPIPICLNQVIYTIDVCNISEVDAFGVEVVDDPPMGFVLNNIVFNNNGCATDQGGIYDIPVGCCISVTLTYDASNASNGYYGVQNLTLNGPDNQIYIDFDGSTTTAEDVIIDGTIDCSSSTIAFSKTVNVETSCEDAFVVYQFTIDNQTNIPLQGLSFTDVLPDPAIWGISTLCYGWIKDK